MNFSGTTPKEIYKWIDDKNKGNDTEYIKCKQDTQEAIDVFLSLYGIQFRTAYQLFIHLKKHLCMTLNKSQSLYRAFIVLTNDEIITLRLSQHFAKRNSTEKAFGKHRKPTLAYHLVIGRIEQDVNPKTDIYYDKIFKGVEIKVREYDLNEFNGNRKAIVDEIVYLLTNGTQPPKITDNKHYINMNKQVIRLTEGDLHKIVRESVRKILKENSMYKNGVLSQSGDINKAQTVLKQLKHNIKQSRKDDVNSRSLRQESVNEVMYNGRSYHGNNSNDWGDLADEREKRMFSRDPNVGTKVSDMDSGQLLNHAKNGLDFSKIKSLDDRIDSKGNIHNDMNNMTPEGWQQWTKDASARMRNWGNYHATRNDYTPNQREQYSQEDYDKARSWNNYRNRGFNAALQQWNK